VRAAGCVWVCGRVGLARITLPRMQSPCAVIYCHRLASLAPLHFSTSHKRHDFRGKKVTERKICFDFLYNFYLKCFSFWEEFRELLSEMWKRLHVKYQLFMSDFNETSFFSTDFRKRKSNIVSGTYRSLVALRIFANARKKPFWHFTTPVRWKGVAQGI
jgi:hypothetical protein